jgi:hypothetical protein
MDARTQRLRFLFVFPYTASLIAPSSLPVLLVPSSQQPISESENLAPNNAPMDTGSAPPPGPIPILLVSAAAALSSLLYRRFKVFRQEVS